MASLAGVRLESALATARAEGRGEVAGEASALRLALEDVLRCFERDSIASRFHENASGTGILVFITGRQADRIREVLGKNG